MTSAEILIAEDNAAMGEVLHFNLARAGFSVHLAEDGQVAWDLAQAQHFKLVITDQQMPRMNGDELCRRLRALPQYRQTPMIMLTAKGLELNHARLESELGVTAVLAKPFSPREIVQIVADQLLAVND